MVVARVVLRKPSQMTNHSAVGQNGLNSHDLRASHAERAHPNPTGIGGNVAADRRGVT